MKSIGIKLADGSFYPLLEEGNPDRKTIDLTTVMNNQKKVQVDVYRTETGSLEDAEYLDTLEITNLRPHQNGEPTLSLAIDVDENNELSAEIRDLETGKSSEFQVQLASRSMIKEGNKVSDEKEVDGDDESNEFSDIAAAQAEKANEEAFDFDNIDESEDEIPEEEANDSTFDFGNIDDINTENSSDDTSLDLPDFDNLDKDDEDIVEEGEVTIDMPDIDTPTPSLETENETDRIQDEGDIDLPSFDSLEENNDETITDDLSDLGSLDDTTIENTEDTTLNDLPSFDSIDEKSNEIEASLNDLPSFDDLEGDTLGTDTSNSEDLFDTSDLNFEDTYDLPDDDNDFSLPDNFADTLDLPEEKETQTSGTGFQMGNNMFTNLYDKETLEGRSSSYSSENETQKKTRAPVVICVICAIICVIAVLLILFRLPSKFNFFTKKAQKEDVLSLQPKVIEEDIEEPVAELAQEPEPIEAKEDEIVVAPSAKDVIPEPKAEVPKAKDIRYKIVWGDTLWDISTAYYKTPWKYKWLADYNKIPNPDHIVSGSWILIPAE